MCVFIICLRILVWGGFYYVRGPMIVSYGMAQSFYDIRCPMILFDGMAQRLYYMGCRMILFHELPNEFNIWNGQNMKI